MDAHAPATSCSKPASLPPPPPPALFLVRARSRVCVSGHLSTGAGGAAFSGPPDTPPRLSPVTVPFLWEDAPGKPKEADPAAAAKQKQDGPSSAHETGDRQQDNDHAENQAPRTMPLKLPPRLQHVSSFAADAPMSPKTVFEGPYHGCVGGRRKPPRWARCGGGGGGAAAAFRRTPSAGVGLFSRTWSNKPKAAAGSVVHDHERDAAAGPDAPWYSPASSSSSSSSASTCFGAEDHGRGRPVADGREVCSEEEEGGSARGLVRITRFRRNRSLPSMATSNLWASIRRSVKQITPWS